MGGTVVDQFDYTYDYAGNRLSRDVASNTAKDQGYSYDVLHRLKTMDQGNWTAGAIATANYKEDWTLDGLGNWSTFTHDDDGSGSYSAGETQARTHNAANEVTAIDGSGSNVAHDAAGNMTSAPKASGSGKYDLKWDAWNRLVEVKDGSTVVATYAYDGQHRRISKTVGSDTDHFYYNEQWQCLEIRRGTETSAAKQEFLWHPYYVDALAIRYENRDGTAGYSGTDEAQIALHDANFNITAMTNTSASVRERYVYNPYGKRTILDSDFSSDDDGVTIGNHYSYTGRELDGETGVYYYRARYYDAGLGRFVNRDPIGYEGSEWNLYEYVRSKAVSSCDPSGKHPIVIACVGACLGSVACLGPGAVACAATSETPEQAADCYLYYLSILPTWHKALCAGSVAGCTACLLKKACGVPVPLPGGNGPANPPIDLDPGHVPPFEPGPPLFDPTIGEDPFLDPPDWWGDGGWPPLGGGDGPSLDPPFDPGFPLPPPGSN